VWCRPTAGNIVYSFNTNSWRKYCQGPWLQCCCCWAWCFGENCLCPFIWLVDMWWMQNWDVGFVMHCLGWQILFVYAVLTGLLIRSICLLGKTSIRRYKLEFWIFMVLSALRITGMLVFNCLSFIGALSPFLCVYMDSGVLDEHNKR